MKSNRVDVDQIDLSALPEASFALSLDYRVSCSEEAYKAVLEHAREYPGLEICGVLVGDVFKDAGGPFVEIGQAIRGEHAINDQARVTFTHESWSHISEIMDTKYPDKKIVGWYHSHPGFGVFLSPQDVFIHSGFFGQPWQVALVVDPLANDEGFFVWRSGEPRLVEQYWIGRTRKSAGIGRRDAGAVLGGDPDITPEAKDKADNRRARPPVLAIVLLLLIVLIGAFFARAEVQLAELRRSLPLIGSINGGAAAPGEEQRQPKEESTPPEQGVSLDKNEIPFEANIKVTRSGGIARCAGTVSTYYQKELLSKVVGASGVADAVDVRQVLVTHEYVVELNDTLEEIARKVYGQTADWHLIYQANRRDIPDPGLILPAMTLRIPEPADDQQ